jgi:translation initiation factor 2B subunit (eIF-2B alpha/beta/delta family)
VEIKLESEETAIVDVKHLDELWKELNEHLQKGIPDAFSLQKLYNRLVKFMSKCFVELDSIVIDDSAESFEKYTRSLILQNYHFNERERLRQLRLSEKDKKKLQYKTQLLERMAFCKDMQRLLKDKLEALKLDYLLSGGSDGI